MAKAKTPKKPRESQAALKQRTTAIVVALQREYGNAECALNFETPFQLLIATILSAQCTDERVNIVTKELFAAYPEAADLAAAPLKTVEKIIQSTGFFRAKAKNIVTCAQQLCAHYQGEVPKELSQLVVLPGVGRKTANVVLGTAYGIASGVVVDTHVSRLSQRLGLTAQREATKIESELMKLLSPEEWIQFSHRLIHHGRRVCKARTPLCTQCVLREYCPQVGVVLPTAKAKKT